MKVKLNGDNGDWDVGRFVGIRIGPRRKPSDSAASANGFIRSISTRNVRTSAICSTSSAGCAQAPDGFPRIQYIEQPTGRDLKANRANAMHEAAKLRPVVIDESLLDLESLQLAREMGYTGAALKACKGQSQSLLMAAAAQKYGMFLCVQDLTCPGASLLQSASLAAHVPGVAAIEANSRQYVPAANRAWEERFPGIFHITDGTMETGCLTGPGLGAVA